MLGRNRRLARLLALCATVPAFAATAASLSAQEQSLASARPAGEISRVEVLLEVGGELSLVEEQKVKPLKMSVVGNMVYDEKLLAGTPASPGDLRSARQYTRCDATIKIDKGALKPRLRDERRLVVAAAGEGRTTMFSPLGPLTREELDLIEIPTSSLLVEALLPDRPVAPGDQWEHSGETLTALLNLDAVSECAVTSTFKEATAGAAQLELAGTVKGAVGGVSTQIELKGRYKFDLQQRRITWVAMLIKEKRAIGHVAPGVDVVARLQMKIGPASPADELSDSALADLELSPVAELTQLEYISTGGRFRFLHDRNWHVINDATEGLAMRMVDRGELIAQCNVSALAKVEPGKRFTLTRFRQDVEKSLGKNFGQFVSAAESETSAGHHVCRVIAAGEVEKLPIQWNYYLTADGQGRQVVFAFTMEMALIDRFGASDEGMVTSLSFFEPSADTARQPTLAPRQR